MIIAGFPRRPARGRLSLSPGLNPSRSKIHGLSRKNATVLRMLCVDVELRPPAEGAYSRRIEER